MEDYRPNERNELLEARHVLVARFHSVSHKLDHVERIAATRSRPSRLAESLRLERDRLGWEIEDVDARLSQLTNQPKEQQMSDSEETPPQVSLDLDEALAIFGAARITTEAMKEGGEAGDPDMAEAYRGLREAMDQFSSRLAEALAETGPGAVLVDLIRKMAEAGGAPVPGPTPAEKAERPFPTGEEQRSPNAARVVERALETDASPDEGLLGKTDCPDLCEVEPDGKCPHGYLSAGRTAGVV